MKRLFLVALVVLAVGSSASADLILRVPDITVTQSSSITTGSFDVFLEETGGTQAVLSAYNVPLRLSPTGTITFTGRSLSSAAHPSLFNQVPADRTGSAGGYVAGNDIYLTDDLSDANGNALDAAIQNGVRDGLFQINYSIPANASPGTFAINIDTNPTLFGLFEADGDDVLVTIDNGSITITPVPEPATLGLAVFAVPLVLRRKR